jgi:hypothetical protein
MLDLGPYDNMRFDSDCGHMHKDSINCVNCTSQNGISSGVGVCDGSHRQVTYRPHISLYMPRRVQYGLY